MEQVYLDTVDISITLLRRAQSGVVRGVLMGNGSGATTLSTCAERGDCLGISLTRIATGQKQHWRASHWMPRDLGVSAFIHSVFECSPRLPLSCLDLKSGSQPVPVVLLSTRPAAAFSLGSIYIYKISGSWSVDGEQVLLLALG